MILYNYLLNDSFLDCAKYLVKLKLKVSAFRKSIILCGIRVS